MINITLKYLINIYGKTEETLLSGLKKNDKFNFGNNSNISVKIVDISNNSITIKFKKLKSHKLTLSNNTDIIELKIGDKVYLDSNITPSPFYCIELLKIERVEQTFWS